MSFLQRWYSDPVGQYQQEWWHKTGKNRHLPFAIGLLVFGVQHYMYAQFVASLIPTWIPARLFWDYLVMVAFFASAISFIIRKLTSLAGGLLGLMFLIWVLILHLPRVIASIHTEPEWTSLFVALAFSGVSFLIAGLAADASSKN
jgi:hypothetical protein